MYDRQHTQHFPAQHEALSQDVKVRTVVHYTDYKRFRSSATIHYGDEVLDAPKPDGAPKPEAEPKKPQ